MGQTIITVEFEFSDAMKRRNPDRRRESLWRPKYEISVHTVDGKKISLEVRSTNTIDDLKEMIKEKIGTPVDMQKLLLNRYHLKNGAATLSYYDITSDSNLHLVRKFAGYFDALSL